MDILSIENAILKFLRSNILAEDVQLNAQTVLREIGVDSYSIVEIVLFIERQYDYVVPDTLLKPENFVSVNSIATMVAGELKQ